MKRISFRSVLKGGLWLWYDHMGGMAVANLLWLVMSLGVVTCPVATAGLFYYTYSLFSGREESLSAFFVGIKKLWWRSLILAGGVFLALALCAANVFFYLLKASQWSRLLGMAGTGIFLWLGIGVACVSLYLFPLLCHHETGFKRILKNAGLLAMANPFLALALFAMDVLVVVGSTVSGIGAFFVMAAFMSILSTLAVVEALALYGGIEPGSLMAERLEGCHEDWKKRDFKYLIRPWE